MRIPALVVALCSLPGLARAQGRLDLHDTPDPGIYAAIWPLSYQHDGTPQVIGSFGMGFGTVRSAHGATATAGAAAGYATEKVLAVGRSELTGWGSTAEHLELQRGRHQLLAQLETGDDLGVVLSIGGALEHGDARGLAPLHLGAGRRTTGDATAEAKLLFDPDDDETFAFTVRGTAGGTRWAEGGRARRLGLGLAFGFTPHDDELPRGMLDFVHARVEHAALRAPVALAAVSPALAPGEVRTVEVGLGAHEMTLNIDHELAAIIQGEFGWAWLQADSTAGRLATNMFTMRLGVGAAWRERRRPRLTRVGLGIARDPEYTPDGTRLAKDWRLEMTGGIESRRLVLGASGGISWVTPVGGGSTVMRYGSEVEGFVKLGAGLELGAYQAATYEPAGGDPFAATRHWNLEYGALLRIRTDLARRAPNTPDVASAGAMRAY